MINDCELGGKVALSTCDWRTMVLIMRQCAAGGGFGMHCWPNRSRGGERWAAAQGWPSLDPRHLIILTWESSRRRVSVCAAFLFISLSCSTNPAFRRPPLATRASFLSRCSHEYVAMLPTFHSRRYNVHLRHRHHNNNNRRNNCLLTCLGREFEFFLGARQIFYWI